MPAITTSRATVDAVTDGLYYSLQSAHATGLCINVTTGMQTGSAIVFPPQGL
jgi:hypothetical protein